MLSLDQFPLGKPGVVDSLDLSDEAYRRVAAFGLIPGCLFSLARSAPFGGPLVLEVGATRFLLRRSLARSIKVRDAA
ncbi:FeoA family protein [uncultured Aquitalea sp.]|uniref:FeoA family protein n=1 Tax=uncultured Aquitalea sp. TaxID=540272 RepID=UPI0025F32BD6|nr:FeoA family protein [uncultured Aquitalea sp.]